MNYLKEANENLREILTKFRENKNDKYISEHILAAEIALSFSDLFLINGRKISNQEKEWFKAGIYLDYILGGSPWEEIIVRYNKVCLELQSLGQI
ncbi:hypothetical protein EGI26_19130 [Lacihabitans sp. CCS-44]|uniref:hypothetical protein n=1 Tax=Lacihabitans sp. CCS-44 TaxID=2487331 RepID=UPI0020CB7AB2|nr:hypothetical protein [Lacihabitans sp. CCS-44]MCP9757279.1 hypothetical protein [Lacihabitans sp. CCS-44]